MEKFIDKKLMSVGIIVSLITLGFFFGLVGLIDRYGDGAILLKGIGVMAIGILLFGLSRLLMSLPTNELNFKNVIAQPHKASFTLAFVISSDFASLALWVSFVLIALVHIRDVSLFIALPSIVVAAIFVYLAGQRGRVNNHYYLLLRPNKRKALQTFLAIEMAVIAIPVVIHLL